MAAGKTIEVTDESFESEVLGSDVPVLVDYWAPWCGPCRGFAPVFEKVAEKHPDVVFAKVNTDEEQEIASHFQIRSIPTLMAFREQIIVFSQPGALPQGAFEQVVSRAKALDMDEVRKQIDKQDAQGEGRGVKLRHSSLLDLEHNGIASDQRIELASHGADAA